MATNSSLTKDLKNNEVQKVDPNTLGIKALMETPTMQNKFKSVLKDKSSGFTSSVLNLVNNNTYLSQAEPMSILTSAMIAATLDLPIDKNLGFAWLVPFRDWKDGNKQKAQFQLGYKGYIQLALRTGQYKNINATQVYEGEIRNWDRFTEEYERGERVSDKVVGYLGYFEMTNGFKKTVYWTKGQIEEHRIRFNKAKDKRALTGVWKDNYDAMAVKTVLRNLLGKWGILSIEMQKAQSVDGTSPEEVDDAGNPIDITDNVSESNDDQQQEEPKKVESKEETSKKTSNKKETKKSETSSKKEDTDSTDIINDYKEYADSQK